MGVASAQNTRGVVSDPNIVPLIDVLLVLIIIFLVITPKPSTGLPAVIPQPAPPSQVELPSTIVVRILKDSKVMINNEATKWSSLGPRLSSIFARRADKIAFVQGSQEAPFEQVAQAIDIMRSVGIEHIGLISSDDLKEK